MKIKTSAKLNLNLEIKNKNSSSLHEISSLIVPIDLYDEIDIVQNEEGFDQIHFDAYPHLSKESTIHKALICLRTHMSVENYFDIRIKKFIPLKAGLGGGSSDAAGVLKSISKILDISLPNNLTIAQEVGSDVPFFINGKPGIIKNVGDEIEDYDIEQEMFFLIIVPSFGMSTKAVFDEWDNIRSENVDTEKVPFDNKFIIFNDALKVVNRLKPELEILKKKIEQNIERKVFMTGTGSTLFAIFDTQVEAENAKEAVNIDNRLILVTKKIDYSYKELAD